MPAAESQALLDLADKPGCAADFSGHDPAAVLTSIITGSEVGRPSIYGTIGFGLLGSNKAAVTQRNGSFLRRRSTSTITINTYVDPTGVYWNTGLANYNAVTLLHELGHVFDFDFGPNSTKIQFDALPNGDSNPIAEAANEAALAACGP